MKSDVAAAYNDWAETYDTIANLTRDMAAQALREADLHFADREIIEVGCGTGQNTQWLAGAGAKQIVALDFSDEMLARAQARVQVAHVRFIQHDITTTWPLADSTADIIVVMLVLEHVEHLEPVFAEAARTLRTNGELFICEFHPTLQLMGKQARFTNARTGENILVPAFLHQTEDYLKAAASAGFELMNAADRYDADAQTDEPPRLLSLLFRLN